MHASLCLGVYHNKHCSTISVLLVVLLLWWTPRVSALTSRALFGHIHRWRTKHPRFSALFSVSHHAPTIDGLEQLASFDLV